MIDLRRVRVGIEVPLGDVCSVGGGVNEQQVSAALRALQMAEESRDAQPAAPSAARRAT